MPTELDGCTYLTCAEVAEACGVSRQTIWRWRQAGVIPQGELRRGRAVLFSETEVEFVRAVAAGDFPAAQSASEAIYLDNAASARPTAAVRDAVLRAMQDDFGNPSSPHSSGLTARRSLAEAREAVAALVGADPEGVVFTSGGTEANNLALHGCVAKGFRRIVISAVEHPSVTESAEAASRSGVEVVVLPVDRSGVVNRDALAAIAVDGSTLVSIQWANSETGVIQPIAELSEMVKSRGGVVHCDAVQAAGKITVDFVTLPIDALTITSHKLHGPQGVGALVLKPSFPRQPLFWGGSQESGRRGGTENYPGIVGFGVAASQRMATMRGFVRRTRAMRDFIESELLRRVPVARINGGGTRVCNITNLSIPGVDGQALVALLDARGIRLSQVSACSNMRPEPSRVLRSMDLSEDDAYSSFRVSVSEDTAFEQCRRAVEEIVAVVANLGGSVTSEVDSSWKTRVRQKPEAALEVA
jgi:cysteine desulfurase